MHEFYQTAPEVNRFEDSEITFTTEHTESTEILKGFLRVLSALCGE
jgi:hypothetical protein